MGGEKPVTSGTLITRDQRHVLIEGEKVLAAWVGETDIYIPLRPMCDALGIVARAQITRIKRDEVMAEHLRFLRIDTPGGPQIVQALHLETVPLWLAGLEPSRVKEEIRPRLRLFKRWIRTKVWEAFATEMGWAPTVAAVTTSNPTALSLEQVAELGRALTTMAEQQLIFQRQQERAMIAVRGTLSQHDHRLSVQEERMDKAAHVMGETLREVKALKRRLDPGNVITDEQAAELQEIIKAIAEELTRQNVATGQQKNHYASLFGELHRRFRVSTYKNLTIEKYEGAMAWLHDYDEALSHVGSSVSDPV